MMPTILILRFAATTWCFALAKARRRRRDEEGRQCQKRELYRSVPLPTHVDADKIDAQYHNGVLSVKLREKTKSPQIEVKS